MRGVPEADEYATRRDPDRPWGYWLCPVDGATPGGALVDEDGRRWASVRDAFWSGRLRMPRTGRAADMVAVLGDVLADVAAGRDAGTAFPGASPILALLVHQRLVVDHPVVALSAEGRAVLAMLAVPDPG